MPSIIACWCTKCDCFQEDGRSCVVCGTALSILPLVDTMRDLENCQEEFKETSQRLRMLKSQAAEAREEISNLDREIEMYSETVKDFCKSGSNLKPLSSSQTSSGVCRSLRRFNRWNKNLTKKKEIIYGREKEIQKELDEAQEASRNTSVRVGLLRLRIREIVNVFQTHFSGVSSEVLDGLPRRICTEEGLECLFCAEDLNGATIVDLPNCDHTLFHDRCVVRWLDRHNSCPVCRAKVQTTQATELL